LVFVVTSNGVEVYGGGNVGEKVVGLSLKANPNCIALVERVGPNTVLSEGVDASLRTWELSL
jgi:hypothetical protein